MKFKGTIIITDPCYVIKKNNYPSPKPADFNLPESIDRKPYKEYKTPDELAYKAACDKYFAEYRKKDDWSRCGCGQNMEVLGIHNYITESTIYGDWSCTTYKITEDPYKVVNNLAEASEKGEDYGIVCSKLGNFCADAGLVSVFNLDEVRKYNPDIDEWIASHDWCVTTIPDFDGEVNYYVDKQGFAHIVGVGNVNFFTNQTGL